MTTARFSAGRSASEAQERRSCYGPADSVAVRDRSGFQLKKDSEQLHPIRASSKLPGFRAAFDRRRFHRRIIGCLSALRGAGDARFIMLSTLAVVGIVIAGLFVGVFGLGYGVYWCWSLQVLFLVLNVSVFAVRFHRGKWREKGLVDANVKLV